MSSRRWPTTSPGTGQLGGFVDDLAQLRHRSDCAKRPDRLAASAGRHERDPDRHRQQVPGTGQIGVQQERNQHTCHDHRQARYPCGLGQGQHAGRQHRVHRVGHPDVDPFRGKVGEQLPVRGQCAAVLGQQGRDHLPGQRDQRGSAGAHRTFQDREPDRHQQQIRQQAAGHHEGAGQHRRHRMMGQIVQVGRGPGHHRIGVTGPQPEGRGGQQQRQHHRTGQRGRGR